MSYVICEPCRSARHKACVIACPTDCIISGVEMCYLDPECCIDCAACAEACPAEAIFHQESPRGLA